MASNRKLDDSSLEETILLEKKNTFRSNGNCCDETIQSESCVPDVEDGDSPRYRHVSETSQPNYSDRTARLYQFQEMTKFDDIVDQTGQYGRYQKLLVTMVVLITIPVAFNTYLPIFVLTVPKHRCAINHNDTYVPQSPYHRQLINESIPADDSCHIWRSTALSNGKQKVKCDKWVFDKEYFDRSVIEELSLVCDRKEWRSHGNMAMMMGKLVSGLTQGICSDNFGRRKTLLVFIVIMVASLFANAFIYNIPTLIAFRFIAGLSITSTFLNCFVIAMEFTGPKYRQTVNTLVNVFWIFGGFILTGIAYGLRDYMYLCIALASPTALLLSAFCLVPESPRWLASQGRAEEARHILEKLARVNRKPFPEQLFQEMIEEEEEKARLKKEVKNKKAEPSKFNENLFSMLRHPFLALRFGIVLYNWIANSLTYYGILFNVQNLSGSIYVNFLLSNTVDLVGTVMAYFLVDRIGRKISYMGFLGMATLSCLAAIFPPLYATEKVSDLSLIILSMGGRLGISTSFNVLFLFCAEIFPTTIRNTAMGTASMTSRIGSISAPYIADLGVAIGGTMESALPLMVFGGAGFLAMVGSCFLPESNGKILPETVNDLLDNKTGREPKSSKLKAKGISNGKDLDTNKEDLSTQGIPMSEVKL